MRTLTIQTLNLSPLGRRVLLFLFVILLSHFASAQKRGTIYAVLVGVSEYSDPGNNLLYGRQDAVGMYNLLKQQTAASNLRLLTNANATTNNILTASRALFSKAKPEDIIIFHFSGHGNSGCFFAHNGALWFSDLYAVFRKSKAKRKMIFADACRSGTLRPTGSPPTNQVNVSTSNVVLFLSSRSSQYSYEGPDLRNGTFTHFLIAGLKGGADKNKNHKITAKELFEFVNPKVKAYSGNRQVPVMWGKFNDNMIILSWPQRNKQ